MSSRYLNELKLGPFVNWYIGSNSGSTNTLTACANCVTGVFFSKFRLCRQSQSGLIAIELNLAHFIAVASRR